MKFYSPIWCTGCKIYIHFLDIIFNKDKEVVHKLCGKSVRSEI